jgi:hypothetical protein
MSTPTWHKCQHIIYSENHFKADIRLFQASNYEQVSSKGKIEMKISELNIVTDINKKNPKYMDSAF